MNINKSLKNILAIETSCDETAAAVLEMRNDGKWPKIKTLSSVVKSQIKLHSKMGGVVPEAAARAHVKWIRPVVESTINNSLLTINDIDYIAVTVGPGLIPSLIVGVEFAKALSFATDKPIIPVNHMAGHLYSPFGKLKANLFPNISLIVSGGHTILVLMENEKKYKVLGQTVDDAAGEAFDKVAKLLGLPYPGGPEVARLALKGNSKAITFPRPMINHKNYNFSFSGLKTAVLYYLRNQSLLFPPLSLSFPRRRESKKIDSGSLSTLLRGGRNDIADVCASFQQAAVDVLVSKTLRAAKEFKAKSISLSGGVAANALLRKELKAISYKLKA
ncbi:MAG: tRNA (adenosine(37)-N6)-threonylcarbamoyltransferase complex transferase subunit TsaD, partial [Candidatus Doudnabacteria bacterium]|nr:tRNA (adenosine(37)-N6)-threonylcarbamoyltransferase complex transferase subunit TsaD [Candidatus Doudnabacteria bacterium]